MLAFDELSCVDWRGRGAVGRRRKVDDELRAITAERGSCRDREGIESCKCGVWRGSWWERMIQSDSLSGICCVLSNSYERVV